MHQQQEPVLVSVLLAARNEENNIERCLQSLAALDFKVENIEILIGDDDSADRTAAIIKSFISDKIQFRYIHISDSVAGLKGKTNVLAQLAKQARGKYFLLCDADIAVPPTWVSSMLKHFNENTGVVVGVTRMKQSSVLSGFLSLEWLFVLGSIRLASYNKIPITGLGNNMALTSKAYFDMGGYEKIGFSIVEDYALFMAIVKKGFDFEIAYNPKILAFSEPVSSLAELFSQRKRWMTGIQQSSMSNKITIIGAASLIPLLLIMAIWMPFTAGLILAMHYLFVTICSVITVIILKQRDLWAGILFFWFYMFVISMIMLVMYVLPIKTVWKGRAY